MGQSQSQNEQQIQKSQINKKFQILEAQQKQYLKNIYEDQRKSNSHNARYSESEDSLVVTTGFLCIPSRQSKVPSQNTRKQVVWYNELVQRLNDVVSNQPDTEYQWARVMVNRFQHVLKQDTAITEIKFQQKCDSDHFFLKLKNIEYDTKMDWLINQKKPRKVRREIQFDKESILIEQVERNDVQKDLQRQSKTTLKQSIGVNAREKSGWALEKDKMAQSESHVQVQEAQLNLEDLMKVRDFNSFEINKFVTNNNEIFDEEMEQVFGKYDLQLQSFSQCFSGPTSSIQKGSSIKKQASESGITTNSGRNSLQLYQNQSQLIQGSLKLSKLQSQMISQLTKEQQKEMILNQIQFQNKILNSIKFYQKLMEFITLQVTQNKKNWLNKVLRLFVKVFIDSWLNRDECLENIYDDNLVDSSNPKRDTTGSVQSNIKQSSSPKKNGIFQDSNLYYRDTRQTLQDAAKISLLQSSQPGFQKEAIKGVQVMRSSIEYNCTEEDITKMYGELCVFINIFRNLIKSYYDIPFVIERFEHAKFLIDDVLWNYTVNTIFDFQLVSYNVFSYQMQLSAQALKHDYDRYKKKFQVLASKEPQFYKVKDQFCLNHLTKMYIFKQDQKKIQQQQKFLQMQQKQLEEALQIKKTVSNTEENNNNNNNNTNNNQEDPSKDLNEQQKQQQQDSSANDLNNNEAQRTSSQDFFNRRSSLKNSMSTLDYQYMKLKEAEERKSEKERIQKLNIESGALLPMIRAIEKEESQSISIDYKHKIERIKEECSQDEIDIKEKQEEQEEEEAKDVYVESMANSNTQQNNIKQQQQKGISASDQTYNKQKDLQQKEEIQEEQRKESLFSKQAEQKQSKDDEQLEEQGDQIVFQAPFDRCIFYLEKVIFEKKPIGKLRLILKAFENIQKCIHRFYNKNRSNEKVKIGPEDLMDISVYILAKSQQYQIIHDIHIVRSFITKNTEYSDKAGYYLQTLEAAFQYIIETEFTRLDEYGYTRLSFSTSYKSFCGGEGK